MQSVPDKCIDILISLISTRNCCVAFFNVSSAWKCPLPHLRALLATKYNKMAYFMCYLKWNGSPGNFNAVSKYSGVLLFFYLSCLLRCTFQVNVCVKSDDAVGYRVIPSLPVRLPERGTLRKSLRLVWSCGGIPSC